MNYSPEKRKQLKDLRDAITAALKGEPVQARDQDGGEWVTLDRAMFGLDARNAMFYRPAPLKVRYRRCVRKNDGHFYVDVVNDAPEDVSINMYFAPEYCGPDLMQVSDTFVKWLDDDWVEVEVEAPV